MIPYQLSIRNVVAVIQILLLHLAMGVALPTPNKNPTSPQLETRDAAQTIHWGVHNRRALESSAIPKIAGGAVGIVAFGLILGLGSASIAVFGSIEWQAYRGKKKEDRQDKQVMEEKGKRESFDSSSSNGSNK